MSLSRHERLSYAARVNEAPPRGSPRAWQEEAGGFRHEALLYRGEEEFLGRTAAFIRDGLEAEEPTLVAVSARKIAALRSELGTDADGVHFAEMDDLGQNPPRIIPVWREFVDLHTGGGRRARGIGEPIWSARSAAELIECQRHESLLNLAFTGASEWWLVCPYDLDALDPAVIEEARRGHPWVSDRDGAVRSDVYHGVDGIAPMQSDPLPDPPAPLREITFERANLAEVRHTVAAEAAATGLDPSRAADMVLAVNELATNSIRHAGGRGVLRTWREDSRLVCEIRDDGSLSDPLAGRIRPDTAREAGYGLWLVNQLCDLVQIRSHPSGSIVRVHMRAH